MKQSKPKITRYFFAFLLKMNAVLKKETLEREQELSDAYNKFIHFANAFMQ